MLQKTLLLLLFIPASMRLMAMPLRGVDGCYDRYIKSIQLHRTDNLDAEPIITLGSGEQTLLTFDDLSGANRSFTYKIILCDADWNESDLPSSYYITGFEQDNILDYRQSFGTLTQYTFFELRIPNANTELLLSGNYKIQVTDSDAPDKVLFQKGFSVVEHTLPFKAFCTVNANTMSGQRNCSQQLDIKISYQGVNVQNPHSDIKVRVMQNGHSQPVTPPEAKFIAPDNADYSFYDKNLYAGGAEYRQFDISSFEYRTLRVRKIMVVENEYQVLIEEDGILHQHLAYIDRNGHYFVRNARYEDNSNTESDYAGVFFTLLAPRPFEGKVYVFGELSNWQLSDPYLMFYNAERHSYELTLPLKQGHYDYRYVLLPTGSNQPDFSAIEHCSHETENLYGIYVYYRTIADRHDRLVCVTWTK